MRQTRLAAAAIASCLALHAASGMAAEPADPLSRTVRLDLWNVSLADTVREIERQTGVEIRFHLADFPGVGETPDLCLVSGRVALRAVIEGLARRYSFRYRVAASGRVEVSRGYGWAKAAPALRTFHAPQLAETDDVQAMRAFLGELVKPLGLLEGDVFLKVERHPLPEDPGRIRITAALPPVAAAYVERAVRCLQTEGGDYPPPGGERRKALFAAAHQSSVQWREWLEQPVSPPSRSDARATLSAVADQAGVAILLHAASAGASASLSGMENSAPLAAFMERLSAEAGLGRPVFLACGAVLFEPGEKGRAAERDERSREFFWDGLAVAGFDARRAAEQVGSGYALMRLLRAEVFPQLWRDPLCALAYSPKTGRLAVVAPLNAVNAVAERLARIQ